MRKALVLALLLAAGCATSFTDIRSQQPDEVREFHGSPAQLQHCMLARHADESVLWESNHLRPTGVEDGVRATELAGYHVSWIGAETPLFLLHAAPVDDARVRIELRCWHSWTTSGPVLDHPVWDSVRDCLGAPIE